MRLLTAHRILIGAAIAFFVLYGILRGRVYLRTGTTAELVQAIVAFAVAAGLLLYFRTLRRWGQR